MIHKKKQQSKQNTSGPKPLFLHFVIVCLLAGVLVLMVAALCHGAVYLYENDLTEQIILSGTQEVKRKILL